MAADVDKNGKISFEELYKFWSSSTQPKCEIKPGVRSCGGLLAGKAAAVRDRLELTLSLTGAQTDSIGVLFLSPDGKTFAVQSCTFFSQAIPLGAFLVDGRGNATHKTSVPARVAGSFSLVDLVFKVTPRAFTWQTSNTLDVTCRK